MAPSRWLLLSTCIISIYINQSKAGDGEKLRINPEVLEKVVQFSNLTKRDRTEKNVNFAWKVTMRSTMSTTPNPEHTSTLSPEQNKKNSEIYDKLFAQLAYTLRDKTYLDRWLAEMDKGYHIFLYQLQKQDRKLFFKNFYGDDLFEHEDGPRNWSHMCIFLEKLGNVDNFKKLVKQIHTNKQGEFIGGDFQIRKLNASAEARGEQSAWNLMQIHLAMTLTQPAYKDKWNEALKKGFGNLLQEFEQKGPHVYLNYDKTDPNLSGGRGGLYWSGIMGYIKSIGEEGVKKLFKKAEALPNNVNGEDIAKDKLMEIT